MVKVFNYSISLSTLQAVKLTFASLTLTAYDANYITIKSME